MKTATKKQTKAKKADKKKREIRSLSQFFLEDSLTDYQFSYQSQNLR